MLVGAFAIPARERTWYRLIPSRSFAFCFDFESDSGAPLQDCAQKLHSAIVATINNREDSRV